MLGGLYKRFRSLPVMAQVVIALLVVGLAIALSPLSLFLAGATFVASLAVLLYRLLTRRPLGPWVLVAVCSFLLIFVFVPTTEALYGTAEQEPREEEEASTPTNTEETPEEEPPEDVPPPEEELPPSPAAPSNAAQQQREPVMSQQKQKPTDPDERIRFNLQEELTREIEEGRRGEDVKVLVQRGQDGCRQVTANYQTLGPTSIETEMRGAYEAVYGDEQIRAGTCRLTLNAYGTLRDRYGQPSQELFYTTHMDQATANRINWQEPWNVRFSELWEVDYVHPTVETEIARENAEQALDCLQEGGFFDFDWLECP